MDDDSELADFMCGKIEKAGGSAQIKYLFQFLPSFKHTSIRTQGELMSFIRKRSNVFQIDANANIRLQASSAYEDEESNFKKVKDYEKPKKDVPNMLEKEEGVIIKLHPTFGFIAVKHPLKTIVYFTPSSFSKKYTLFADIPDLNIGTKLCLNAVRGNEDHYSKYRALKVWLAPKKEKNETIEEIPNNCAPKPRKTRETGLYDPVVNEGEGKIFKLFTNYGFIAVEDNKDNTVFFYKNQISNYENVLDLTKALKVGDLVEFKAVRSSMKNIKARWSATQVWIKKSSKTKFSSNSTKDVMNKELGNPEEERYIKKIPGKIFPHSKGTVIKFGKNYEQLADADSGLFYMLGAKVQDVSWEFTDGDDVLFDAVKIKSHPGWKAILVWTGERPRVVLPPDLGDFSEYTDEPDNVPDSASCVSKSSNNSGNSDVSNKSFRKPISRSSGYSSLKNSVENINQSKKSKFRNPSGRRKFDNELDDLSDSASCYSRSSNVSSESGYRFKENRNQKKNDLNFRKRSPNKSQKRSEPNAFKKSSFEGRNFAASNVGTFSKPRKHRFLQSHIEFSRSDLTNSKTDEADNYDSTLPDTSKDGLMFLGTSQNERVYTNWGDSPYPDEENENKSVLEDKETNSLSDREPSPVVNSVYDSNTTDCEDKGIYSSGDEFSDAEQNRTELPIPNDQKEKIELLKSSENGAQSDSEEQSPPKKASITRFREIQGNVTKVYCKYAYISSPKLLQPATFFWSDLYMNGTIVSNSGVDDLREVLKEGNVLNFNCYQIINDEGCCFIKVTVVWRDKKPNIVEMTPEQFITEVNLSVTLHEDSIRDYSENSNPPSISHKSQEEDDVDENITKFLTTLSDSEGEVENEVQNSVSKNNNLPKESALYTPPHARKIKESSISFVSKDDTENASNVNLDLNKNQLIMKISEIISSNAYQADVNNTSSKIVDFLLNSGMVNKFSTSPETTETESQTEIDQTSIVTTAHTHIANEEVEHTNTEVQTIFTGEVIGKSIFTMC